MKNFLNTKIGQKLTALFGFAILLIASGKATAQTTTAGQIEEVKVYKSSTTKILENKIAEQIDMTSIDAEVGKTYFSNVKFTVGNNGKVSVAEALGENASINQALEAALKEVDLSKYPQITSRSYVLPVTFDFE